MSAERFTTKMSYLGTVLKKKEKTHRRRTQLYFSVVFTHRKYEGAFPIFFFGAVLCFTSCSQVNNARALLKRKRERENGYLRKYVAYQPIKQFSSFFFLLVYLETKKTTKKPVFQSPQKRAIPFFFFLNAEFSNANKQVPLFSEFRGLPIFVLVEFYRRRFSFLFFFVYVCVYVHVGNCASQMHPFFRVQRCLALPLCYLTVKKSNNNKNECDAVMHSTSPSLLFLLCLYSNSRSFSF